jgi:hypothetical protein
MFSETDVGYVTIALALYSVQEKNRPWIKECYRQKRIQYTHENLKTDLVLNEPNDYKYLFVRFNGPSFVGILKTTIAKETLTCEMHCIHHARLFGHGK